MKGKLNLKRRYEYIIFKAIIPSSFLSFYLNRSVQLSSMTHNFNQMQSKPIRCAICRVEIKTFKGTYQSPEFHSIVCKDCIKQFSPNDIDLILSLFYVYGGYYGQKKALPFSIVQFLPHIMSDLKENDEKIEDFIDEFSKKAFHQALLHGLTPSEYLKSLRSLLD